MIDVELNDVTKTVAMQYYEIKSKDYKDVTQSLINTMPTLAYHFFIGDDDPSYALNYVKNVKNNITINKNIPNRMHCEIEDELLLQELTILKESFRQNQNVYLSTEELVNDLIIYHLQSLIDLIL